LTDVTDHGPLVSPNPDPESVVASPGEFREVLAA
jgi:hypothetical protein